MNYKRLFAISLVMMILLNVMIEADIYPHPAEPDDEEGRPGFVDRLCHGVRCHLFCHRYRRRNGCLYCACWSQDKIF
ncbi:unnamed protein product [Gordionus sp. m RMFG-2023]